MDKIIVMKLNKHSILFLILIISLNIFSQSVTVSKKFDFEYPVSIESIAEIKNIYGDITFEAILENKIIVSGEIKSVSTKESKANKRLGMAMIYKDTIENKVIIETKILEKDFKNDFENKLSVNYIIKVPRYLKLIIENKYGNIYLGEHHGKINIDLYNGNLTANKLLFAETQPLSKLKTKYADVKINKCNLLELDCSSTNLRINNLKTTVIRSDNSRITIDTCSIVKSNSFKDLYVIKQVSKIDMKSKKTKLNIDVLESSIDFEGANQNITIKYIPKFFTSIKISNLQGNVNLYIDDNASYNLYCKADLGEVNLPQKANLDKYISKDYVKVEGVVGSNKNTSSNVNITTSYGKISL